MRITVNICEVQTLLRILPELTNADLGLRNLFYDAEEKTWEFGTIRRVGDELWLRLDSWADSAKLNPLVHTHYIANLFRPEQYSVI